MEDMKKNHHPSLPRNYVSLADLQQRWLKQQQEKREKEETQHQQDHKKRENEEPLFLPLHSQQNENENVLEIAKPETQFQEPNSLNTISKPNFKNQKPFRRNHFRDRNGPKEYRLVKVSNPIPNDVAIDGPDQAAVGSGNELKSEIIGIDGPDQKEMKKKKKKNKRREKIMKKVGELEIEGSKIEDNVTIELDSPDQKVDDKKTKKKNNNKNKKTTTTTEKPKAVNNGEERENERNLGSEVEGKRNVGDQTVEIGRRFEGLAVKGRWTAVIDGTKRRDGGYGSIMHRGMGIKRRENNGFVWVKKV